MAKLEIEITALDKTSGQLKGVAKSLDGLDIKTKSLSSAFAKLESTLTSVSKRIVKMGAVLGATLSGALSGLGYAMVKTNAQFEKFQITLTTLYKDGGKAKQVLDSIMDFAASTPFEIDQLTQAWVQMKAMGLEPNLETLRAIGDTTAALGGSEEVFQGIIRALGQMQAKGKVSAEELMQLAERGIPVYEILAEKLGLTKEQLANIGSEGIEANRAIQALIEGMQERFGGNMEKMSSSWSGMVSNLKDQWTRFLKAIGESGAFQALKGRLKSFLDSVDNAFETGKAQKWAEIIGTGITIFVDGAGAAARILVEVGKLIYNVAGVIVETGQNIGKLHAESSNFWADTFKGIAALFGYAVNKLAGVAIEAGGWISKEVGAPIIATFTYIWEKFKNTAIDAINWVAKKIAAFVDKIVGKIPWLKDKVAPGIEDIVPRGEGRSYEEILQNIQDRIETNTQKAKEFTKESQKWWEIWGKTNSKVGKFVFTAGETLKEQINTTLGNIGDIAKETNKAVTKQINKMKEVSQKQDEAFKNTQDVIEKEAEKTQEKAKSIWDKLREFFSSFWENFKKSRIGSALNSMWQGIKSAFGQGAKEGETGFVAQAKNAFSNIMSGASVGGIMGAAGAFLMDQLLQNEKIRNALQKIFEAVQVLITPIAEVIAPVIEVIAEVLLELRPVFKLIAELLKPIAKAVASILKVLTKIDSFFETTMKSTFETIKSAIKSLTEMIRKLFDAIKSVTNIGSDIPIVGDVIDAGKDLWDDTIGSIFHKGGLVKPVVAHKGMFIGSLAPDEVPVIAQQGEYVVNRQATSQYLPVLQAINEGRFAPQTNVTVNIYAEKLDREFVEEELVPMLEDLIEKRRMMI